MNNQSVVEIVTFKLKAGASEQDFLQAANAIQTDLQTMSGYMSRELLKDEHDGWIDLIHWQSMEQALAAAEAMITLPGVGLFITMIDETSMTMRHLHQIRNYNI
jgi:hypothetical protein